MKAAFFGVMAIDDITLPSLCLNGVVGGSAVYGALAAGLFCETGVISVLGSDFPEKYLKMMKQKGIDLSLLQKSKKPCFRWVAEYSQNLSSVRTLDRQIGCYSEFDSKKLKGKLTGIKALFVSKNDPVHQLALFKLVPKNTIKIMETRGNWITNFRDSLKKALKLADIFLVHEDELKLLVGDDLSLPEMIERLMVMGPKVVVLMRGEHGVVMYGSMGTLIVPAYPMAFAVDPTGAGDVLGGALTGVLGCLGKLTPSTIRRALLLAAITASFAVEDYGTKAMETLTLKEVVNRTKLFLHQLPTSLDEPALVRKLRK